MMFGRLNKDHQHDVQLALTLDYEDDIGEQRVVHQHPELLCQSWELRGRSRLYMRANSGSRSGLGKAQDSDQL